MQPFTRFSNGQKLTTGFVRGPNSDKRHAVVLLGDSSYNIGFMASTVPVIKGAGFIPAKSYRTYIIPNIGIDKKKIIYFPEDSDIGRIARKLAYPMHIVGNHVHFTNPNNIQLLRFQTENFTGRDPYTKEWDPINKTYTPQLPEPITFTEMYEIPDNKK